MDCCGIIAEYNPFHNGHLYHIEQTRRITGKKRIIAVMSGGFVQRGGPALFDKLRRAEWALKGGAAMVIELPAIFALSSAEQFARGGVKILAATGLCDSISFGSECRDLSVLNALAKISGEEKQQLDLLIKQSLSKGLSYPAAFKAAVSLAYPDCAMLLDKPNALLGIEYIRACHSLSPDGRTPVLSPFLVERKASEHTDSEILGSIPSASAVRRNIMSTFDEDLMSECLPKYVFDDIYVNKLRLASVSDDALFKTLAYKVLSTPLSRVSEYAEVSEGLENVIIEAVKKAHSMAELTGLIKTKRYSYAKIRRCLMSVLLDIDKQLQSDAYSLPSAPYIRVLGVRRDSTDLLSSLAKSASAPVITSAKDAAQLDGTALKLHNLDVLSSDLQSLLYLGNGASNEFSRRFLLV